MYRNSFAFGWFWLADNPTDLEDYEVQLKAALRDIARLPEEECIEEARVITSDFQEAVAQGMTRGRSQKEAWRQALIEFGNPEFHARQYGSPSKVIRIGPFSGFLLPLCILFSYALLSLCVQFSHGSSALVVLREFTSGITIGIPFWYLGCVIRYGSHSYWDDLLYNRSFLEKGNFSARWPLYVLILALKTSVLILIGLCTLACYNLSISCGVTSDFFLRFLLLPVTWGSLFVVHRALEAPVICRPVFNLLVRTQLALERRVTEE